MIRSTSLRSRRESSNSIRPLKTAAPQEPRYPTKAELLACLTPELLKIDTTKAWGSLGLSLGLSLLAYGVGSRIPLTPIAAPLWLLYALITGTVAIGCWVIAHECGHQAFHPNRRVEATVGFVLHSLLLVPYFSWQRSHAVHHANCNHLEGGETHVPPRAGSASAQAVQRLVSGAGPVAYGLFSLVTHLLLGWPLYLLFGVAGGEDHGAPTSHFWHGSPFRNGRRPLFPDSSRRGMLLSNVGLVVMLLALGLAMVVTSPTRVLAVYGLPYLVINAWLVGYTWLQHTDTTIPHFATAQWTWAKGALQTVDRPYGPLLNLLHHGIGSTHVCHHVNPRIPHYKAWRGNELLRARYPELVRFDPTPIHRALWRIASRCAVVSQQGPAGGFYYQDLVAVADTSA
ncbi:MAG: fatty acid desaturase [Cyanobium sp. CZS 48M]|nr:fatty acid desaturase [Cyanobium sp. CZS48M]